MIFTVLTSPVLPYSVNGRIMYNNIPVIGVEINIIGNSASEPGKGYSDEKGYFLIEDIYADKVIIDIYDEGYSPIQLEVIPSNTNINLGIINLEKVIELDEVTIAAKSKINMPNKSIVYVSKIDKERAANPFNMLTLLSYKAPQIQVRESEKTITIGGEEPVILVNGIRRSKSFVSSIKPDAIEKIEFSSEPDIRYGKRYLNIITQRLPEGGWIMADLVGSITTPRFSLNGVAEYSKGKNDFMIYYKGDYRKGTKEFINEQEHYKAKDIDITFNMEGMPSSTLDRNHNIYFYFTRLLSDKSMFNAVGSLNLHDNNRKVNDYVTDMDGSFYRYNNRGFNQLRPNLSLYYSLNTSEKTFLEINAFSSYSDYDTHRSLTYSTGYESKIFTSSQIWYFATEALWKQKLPFGWLSTGTNFSYNKTFNKYNINSENNNQHLSNKRVKAYTSLSGNLLTVGYNLSAGLTYFKVEKEMISPDLMASLQKDFCDYFSISYNFRYNPQLPSLSNYNDVATPVNSLMYRIGTNKIKSQRNLSNQIQFEFNKDKVYLSLQSSFMKNYRPILNEYSYQDNPDMPLYGFFLEIPGNGKSFSSYGADFTVGISNLWNFLSLRASTGWGHNRLISSETFTICAWYLDFNTNIYWNGWQLNLTAENLVPSWSMFGGNKIIRRWPYTSLTIYKKLGKWNLHVSWNNILQKYGGRYRTETLSSVVSNSSDFMMRDQGNMVEIGIRYQFTTGKLLSKKKRSINLSSGVENGIDWDY